MGERDLDPQQIAAAPARLFGTSVPRQEDEALLAGRGRYVDDIVLPGMLHAAFVRSPHAHAKILGIDASTARGMPSVRAVLTLADFGAPFSERRMPQTAPIPAIVAPITTPYPLAKDEACFVGEAVAMVIAADRHRAEDAAAAVAVDYAMLPAVVDCEAALRADAPRAQQGNPANLAGTLRVHYGDVDAAFAAAPHRFELSVAMHRGGGHSMECRGAIGAPDPASGGLTLWTSTQLPHTVRKFLAIYLGWDEDRVRVIAPDVGGGFGPKGIFYPEEACIALAAIKLGVPVKWIEDRREHFLASVQQRDQRWRLEVAAAADGRILGVRGRGVNDAGAYLLYGLLLSVTSVLQFPGPYAWGSLDLTLDTVFTNLTPTSPVRGAGRPYAAFVIERIVDCVARELRLDPAAVRRRNFIRPEQFPYATGVKTPAGAPIVYDSGQYEAALDRAVAMIDYAGFALRRNEARGRGRFRGIGIASYAEDGGIPPFEGATVRVLANGKVLVLTGAASQGQGHATVLAQICADQLGLEATDITVRAADTGLFPRGIGTLGSRIAVMAGSSVHLAALQVREKVLSFAAAQLQCDAAALELAAGFARLRAEPDQRVSIAAAALQLNGLPGVPVRPGLQGGLEATAYHQSPRSVFSSGTNAVEVEIDPDTGHVWVERCVFVHDCGRMINPQIVAGQIVGGFVHGLGNALLERMSYDPDGQPLSTNYGEYLLPLATDVPHIETAHIETPSPLNPLGMKGAGESGTIPAAPAIVAAIENALSEFDVRIGHHPVTPFEVAEWIGSRRPSSAAPVA